MTHPKITNKVILVTGGVGSIGSELVKKILELSPKQIRILDNSELGLFNAQQNYAQYDNLRFLLGDVRDKHRVNWAMRGVDTVFHTAALKHVALNEYSPFESVKTNVIGTQNLLEAALNHQVTTFINISTDKAANPTSTMGASKLLAERLTAGAAQYQGQGQTVFASVRFGNVLNSSGSVVPIFLNQIKIGGPITITDKNMVRYFMTIPDAVDLILKTASMARGGEVFILKMPALKIVDLAQTMINALAKKPITIKAIGKRTGEKLFEKIVTRTEAILALELEEMYVLPTQDNWEYYRKIGGRPVAEAGVEPKEFLTQLKIKDLLIKAEVI